MDAAFDHNKLLKKVAKDRLTPHGIVQKGNSRTFLYDNGWWTIVIEFQPSSFSKGAYLNIGVDFNFYPRDYFAFQYGYREKDFEKADGEAQFEQLANAYCDHIIDKVEKLKTMFKDAHFAIKTYKKQNINSAWDNFNLGILFGIAGQLSTSEKYFKKVIKEKCENEWEFEREGLVKEILSWLNDYQTFMDKIKELINRTRQMKKLPVVDLNNLQEGKAAGKSITGIWYRLMGK